MPAVNAAGFHGTIPPWSPPVPHKEQPYSQVPLSFVALELKLIALGSVQPRFLHEEIAKQNVNRMIISLKNRPYILTKITIIKFQTS